MNISINQGWLEAMMLASVRIVAFLMIAPPFSHNAIPLRIKGMLGLGLAVSVSPVVTNNHRSVDLAGFVQGLLAEIVVGACLGFLVFLVFAAVQSAGSLVDLFAGFQMASAFDPQGMINGAQFTRLFHMTATVLLFASDGYQLVIGGLIRTFLFLPLGGTLDPTQSGQAIVAAASGMFVAALQIAGPIVIVLFLADVGLGLLTRVAPALQAFSLGFPLKIFITLSLGGIVFAVLPRVVAAFVQQMTGYLAGGH